MNPILVGLTAASLRELARMVERGRAIPDGQRLAASGAVPPECLAEACLGLEALHRQFETPLAVAAALRLIAQERESLIRQLPAVEVVWSGPVGRNPQHRTTWAVAQSLFRTFDRRLILSTYGLHPTSMELFRELAARMDAAPALSVELFVNLPSKNGESEASAVAAFLEKFRTSIWPGRRLPSIWYDPRSLRGEVDTKAVLHAKAVIADDRAAFVTSANLTEAAHDRNIELGVMLRAPSDVRDITRPFEELVSTGAVKQVPE